MKWIRFFTTSLTCVVLWCAMTSPSWAAQCSNVFGAPNGINSNLQASGNTLDLSGVPFANTPWPASGTTLTSGDYYFRSANLENGYRLNVANGAQVRIFVNGSLNTGNNVDFNPSRGNDQFLLVVNGSFSTGNNTEIRGLVYASGAISLGNNVDVRGGLAAGGGIATGNRPIVADYSGVDAGLLEGLCAGPVELRANGQSQGPVTIDVGDTVDFSVEAESCPTAQGVFFGDEWIDNWSVVGGPSQQSGFSASPCNRSVVWSQTFDEEGTYTVSYRSEYCSASFFVCTQYTEFGSDDIMIEVRNPTDSLNCDTQDDFSGGSLAPDLWVTSSSNGNFTPGIVGGRLRMTEAVSNQATAATLQAEIPGADNLVILQFDYYAYDGSGADGVAVVLSDSAFTAQPGSYGGSLGYAQRLGNDEGPGFAGGWLGVGIDEYGNFSNESEGRDGGSGFTPQSVAIRGSGSGFDGYRYLRGTGGLTPGIDATGRFNTHTYEITVDSRNDGEAIVSVRRDTGNGMQELIAPFNVLAEQGQASVPENFLLSLTGSTGGSTNIHELDNVELCALRINPVGEQVDHFEIVHDGLALTCQPETVSIRACANGDCSELFTDPVQATLEPLNGWGGGNVVSLTNGIGAATLQNTAAGDVSLDVIGSQPSARPQSVTLCEVGGSAPSAANCVLPFVESGLAFAVPGMISHRTEEDVEVRAVQKDPETEACVPAFKNVDREVTFYSTYIDPDANGRPVSRPLSIDGIDISGNGVSPTPITLNFDADGIAQIDVRYPDAGQLQLDARYEGSAVNEDAGLVLEGRDDDFEVRPVGLCVTTAGECAAADASCSKFVKADDEFDLSIEAVGWQSDTDSDFCTGNPNTPNFEMQNIELETQLVEPSAGRQGGFSPNVYNHLPSDNATTVVPFKVSEVGVFRFVATPTPNGYFGQTIPPATSDPAGRFYPDRFDVSVSGEGAFVAECSGSFTYTGQAFGWDQLPYLEIRPLSVDGNRTENYADPGFSDPDDLAFQKLLASDITRTAPLADASALNVNDGPLAVTVDSNPGSLKAIAPGILEYGYSTLDQVRYSKVVAAKVAPVANPALLFTVDSIADSDGVAAENPPYEIRPLMDFEIRYGRLSLENAYGPENLNLPVPFEAQVWNGTRFERHSADNCWTYDTSDAVITETPPNTTVSSTINTLVNGAPASSSKLVLSAPGEGNTGSVQVEYPVPAYLQDDFDGDGNMDDPTSTATFGVYRGHDRVIYWQEK